MSHRPDRSSRLCLRLLALTAVPLSLAVSVPSLAQAADEARGSRPQAVALLDRTGDMWTTVRKDGEVREVEAPRQRIDDVRRFYVSHRFRAVVVREHFVAMRRVGGGHRYDVVLKTSDGVRRSMTVVTGPGRWDGRAFFGDTLDTIPCEGLQHSVDYADDVVRMRIPRSCLDTPSWVKAKAANGWYRTKDGKAFYDNPFNAEMKPDRFTRRLVAPVPTA